MSKTKRLVIPAGEKHNEIIVVNSRFIGSIAPVFSVEEARQFIAKVRAEHPAASHHVPAFIIGHGSSIIEHSSDDGEPAGTAGRPALAVLKGSGLGDVVVVVTRYFGGTKLGTGGLVRAYTEAVKAVLEDLPLAEKISTHTVRMELPYSLYERIRLLILEYSGHILDEDFAAKVTLKAQFPAESLDTFQAALREISQGPLRAEIIGSDPDTIFPLKLKKPTV